MNIDVEAFLKAHENFAKTHTICDQCLGVGCMPEDFGIGNTGKPCTKCNGEGSIKNECNYSM